MANSIIAWNPDRFVMRQFMETGAVYIYDKVDNCGYINQTEVARLCEMSQSAVSKYSQKTPKDLEALLGKSLQTFQIQSGLPGRDYVCIRHDDLNGILHYAVVYASGKENRLQAQKLLFKFGEAGSLAYIMHITGVKTQAVIDEDILVETIDVHDRIKVRLNGTQFRKTYCNVLANAYDENFEQWELKKGLNIAQYMAMWTNFTYSLLLGTNAQGLRAIKFADGKLIIGRNHIAGTDVLKAIQTVENYVSTNYDGIAYNNLKKLHIEGSQIAVLQYRIKESQSYIKNVTEVRELPHFKSAMELPGTEQNLIEGAN